MAREQLAGGSWPVVARDPQHVVRGVLQGAPDLVEVRVFTWPARVDEAQQELHLRSKLSL